MDLVNEYFVLYQGNSTEQNHELEEYKGKTTNEIKEFFALILACKQNNFDSFIKSESLKNFFKESFFDIHFGNLILLQHKILLNIQNSFGKDDIKYLNDCFEYLQNGHIINKDDAKKLIAVFHTIKVQEDKKEDTPKDSQVTQLPMLGTTIDFKTLKSFLYEYFILLKNEVSPNMQEILEDLKNSFENKKFTLAITGVMNAGKSTMLNSLLGQELLGTNNIPETANLTILNHSSSNEVKVHFWKQEEWDKIKSSVKMIPQDVNDYIDENEKVITIDKSELTQFTSSKNRLSVLVKYVEMGASLNFLDERIQIVDTPGLDDPITLRETITKEFTSQCDMILHLMNASQSATKKDIDFIIDAIIYQKVSHVTIVLTRIDGISKSALDEVISYTKTQIKLALKNINKASQFNHILKHLEFFPISSLMALYHKTNRSELALQKGYIDIQSTGLQDLENYLYQELFEKEDAKGMIGLYSLKQKLDELIKNDIEGKNYALELLSFDEKSLENEVKKLQSLLDKQQVISKQFNNDLKQLYTNMKHQAHAMEEYVINLGNDLKSILVDRVQSDIKYSFSKKEKVEYQRIESIAKTAINDGIMDIMRDFRFKYAKSYEEQFEKFTQKNKNISLEVFDAGEFFRGLKNNVLITNYDEFLEDLQKKVYSVKEKNFEEFLENLSLGVEIHLGELFSYLLSQSKKEFKSLDEKLFKEPQKMKKILEQEINKLSTNIENFTTNMDKTNKEQLKDELKNSITRLQKYQENLRTQL